MRNLIYIIYTLLFCWLVMLANNAKGEDLGLIKKQIAESALQNGIDPNLALAIAEVESKFNPKAVGSLGEVGIFQLRPEYHMVIKGHTKRNIDVAIKYLAKLKVQCRHYGDAFFVCFNYGPTRRLKYPKQFPYYVKVKAVQERRVSSIAYHN